MTAGLLFAFVVGAIATVNPCGFALLPAFLARRLGTEATSDRPTLDAVARAFAVGTMTTAGFLLVFGIFGGIVSLGAQWLGGALPWAGLVIGVVFAATGIAVMGGRGVGLRLPVVRPAAVGSGLSGDLLFGVGYGTASLSCTLPVFLAVTGTAITGDLLASTLSFVAYALGMGTVLTALAVAAALSRSGLAAAFGRLLPYVSRASGAVLFAAGVYVAYFWGYSLLAPDSPGGGEVIAMGERLSGSLRGWLGGATGQTILLGLLAFLAVLSAWALWRRLPSTSLHGDRDTDSAGLRSPDLNPGPRGLGGGK